jgi:hypothetical protein
MAFCTKCGAPVGGAFCNQCGAPTNQAAAQPMPPAPQRRGMHPLLWVLVIILCLFGIGIAGMVGVGL